MAVLVVTSLEDGPLATPQPGAGGLSLRGALALANADPLSADQIVFADELAGGELVLTQGALTIAGSVTIEGAQVTINGGGLGRVFDIDDGDAAMLSTVALEALVITGGAVTGDGGGLRSAESLTLRGVVIAGNAATGDGGGLALIGGGASPAPTLSVTASEISGNAAYAGGGAHLRGHASATLSDSTIVGNDATLLGGGVRAEGGSLLIEGGVLRDNAVNREGLYLYAPGGARGGGISVSDGALTVRDALIEDNIANGEFFFTGYGGGIAATASTTRIENSIIRGNGGFDTVGGGVDSLDGDLFITGGEISGNRATGDFTGGAGGGVRQVGGTLLLSDVVVSANRSGGSYFGSGGGVYSIGVTTIEGGRIADNATRVYEGPGTGGGVVARGVLSMSDVVVHGNTATGGLFSDGVGGGVASVGSTTISRSLFSDNQALGATYAGAFGGGLATVGDAVVSDSAFIGNRVASRDGYQVSGGGVFGRAGALTLERSEVSANVGGGVSLRPSLYGPGAIAATLSNTTVSGNLGDGVAIRGGALSLLNSTVVRNTGVGVSVAGDGQPGSGIVPGDAVIGASVIADNVFGDVALATGGAASSLSGNLIGVGDGVAFVAGQAGDLVGSASAPLASRLGPLQDNGGPTRSHVPLVDSPALDAGGDAGGLTVDQRGRDRVVSEGVDVGAVERQALEAGAVVLYRVNAGGPTLQATDGGPDWTGDAQAAPSAFVVDPGGAGWGVFRASNAAAYGPVVAVEDLPPGAPGALFESERFAPGGAMRWEFAVDPGLHRVTLFFAELWTGVDAAGERVFDVAVEGAVPAAFADIDAFARGGPGGGFAVSADVAVIDGALTLDLLPGAQRPDISAIEIVALGPQDDVLGDPTTAAPLPVGGVVRGRLDFSGDEDWFAVDLSPGVDHAFALTSAPPGADLRLYDETGAQIAESDDGRIVFGAPAGGRVFVAAVGQTPGDYAISLRFDDDIPGDPSTTEALAVGARALGRAQFEGDEDWFAVDLAGGVQYLFTLDPAPASSDPLQIDAAVLRLYDADGAPIMLPRDDFGQDFARIGKPLTYTPDADQRVFISASGTFFEDVFFNFTANGDYVIGVEQITPQLTPLFRVNVGGPALAAEDGVGPDWSADTPAAPSAFLASISPGWSVFRASNPAASPLTAPAQPLPPSAPAALFATERFDARSDPDMAWEFPVAAGDYTVRLYFAELFASETSPGERVFDVALEGATPAAFTNIDAMDFAGAGAGFVRSADVRVEDGALSLRFQRIVGNPDVSAIEILRRDPGEIPGDDSTFATLTPGEAPRPGRIDFVGDNDWYAVALDAGDTYVFTLARAPSLDPPLPSLSLTLYSETGQALNGFRAPREMVSFSYTAAADETVFIASEGVTAQVGDYLIDVARLAPAALWDDQI